MTKINLPKEGYPYFPEDKPEMHTIGGEDMFFSSKMGNKKRQSILKEECADARIVGNIVRIKNHQSSLIPMLWW